MRLGHKMINFMMGALIGFAIYRFFSRLYGAGISITLIKVAELYCLQLLVSSYEDWIFLKETKINIMKEFKISENKIKISRNLDDVHIKRWKHKVIQTLLMRYPESFRGAVEYHDWESAMRYLDKVIKKT